MDLLVLVGLKELIANQKPAIFIEVEDRYLSDFLRWLEINDYLVAKKYRRYKGKENYMVLPVGKRLAPKKFLDGGQQHRAGLDHRVVDGLRTGVRVSVNEGEALEKRCEPEATIAGIVHQKDIVIEVEILGRSETRVHLGRRPCAHVDHPVSIQIEVDGEHRRPQHGCRADADD